MANAPTSNILAGVITLESGQYEVILKKVGAKVGAKVGNGNGNNNNASSVAESEENNNNNNNVGPPLYNLGGGKKSKKDKKAKGTRKLSGYMKFAQEARPKVLAAHPEMKSDIVKVGRKIGEMWRGLSADEKARY